MAKFEKGQSGNPTGKPAGTLSKDTKRFKEALNELLESQADKMVLWLEEIDNPKQRFDVIKDLAEYIHPKLARTDMQALDKNGQPTDPNIQEVRITLVDTRPDNS